MSELGESAMQDAISALSRGKEEDASAFFMIAAAEGVDGAINTAFVGGWAAMSTAKILNNVQLAYE